MRRILFKIKPYNILIAVLVKRISWILVLFFIIVNIFSVITSFSVRGDLILWGIIEINLFSFIGLIVIDLKKYKYSLSLKYFRFQVVASIFVLFSLRVLSNNGVFGSSANIIILIRVFCKLGFAPLHMWFVSILTKINWFSFVWASFIQKIVPLVLLFKYLIFLNIFFFVSVFVSVRHGLIVTKFKKIIILSSVFYLNWIYITMLAEKYLWLILFLFYNFFKVCVIIVFNFNSPLIAKSISAPRVLRTNLIFFFTIIGFAGVPPRPIFFLKIISILLILANQCLGLFNIFVLLFGSILMIYVYLNCVIYYICQAPRFFILPVVSFQDFSSKIFFKHFCGICLIFTLFLFIIV